MSASYYNPRKAAQVVAYFAQHSPNHRINIVKAVKLVYLADREALSKFGFPILDEDRVSMPLGPVNSTTYRFINGEMEDDDWSSLLQDRANHEVALAPDAADCDFDELSEADIDCLDSVWKRFGHMDRFELVRWTHEPENIPEWEDPNGSSSLIPMRRILKMLKIENAEEQAQVVDDHRKITKLLNSLRG